MKSQKGITLISLIVYIIAMTIAVTIMSVLTSYFYKNVDITGKEINPITEYLKFETLFVEEVNNKNIKVLECKDNYIVFNNSIQYTFVPENRAIYKNKVRICRNVENCTFSYDIKNNKEIVTINMKIEDGEPKNVEYVLKN